MIKNYYEVLQISRHSNQKEIKAAYRKLVLFWHPDRNSNPIALDKIKLINEAYEILSNEEKKIVYDTLFDEITNRMQVVKWVEGIQSEKYNSQEEDIYRKFSTEFEKLNSWIGKIKFNIKDFDQLLYKNLIIKHDIFFENFFYILPYIFLIIFIIAFIIFFVIR